MSAAVVAVAPRCTVCGQSSLVEVDAAAYEAWQAGRMPIQAAFPAMSADEREVLISGTHPACWDQLFGEPVYDLYERAIEADDVYPGRWGL